MRIELFLVLAILSGCDNVSRSDISNAMRMCAEHDGLKEVLPSRSADYVDVYCNSGAQFTGVAKIRESAN